MIKDPYILPKEPPPKNGEIAWNATNSFFDGVEKRVNPFSRDHEYYDHTNNPLKNQFVGVWSSISPFLGVVCLSISIGVRSRRHRHPPTDEALSCEDCCNRFTGTVPMNVDDSCTGLDMVCVCVCACVCLFVRLCDRGMAKVCQQLARISRFSYKLQAVGDALSCWALSCRANTLKTRRYILVLCVAFFCSALPNSERQNVVSICSFAVCCSVLPCVAACFSVLRCVAVCCSVLQCVAVLWSIT